MDLRAYFAEASGVGVLATADGAGKVDAAIYARPQVMDDGSLALIMRDRLTHKNLQENPSATYLFIEQAPGYQGVRLFLKKIREDDRSELIENMTRSWLSAAEDKAKGPKFIVFFEVLKILNLIGGESPE